MDDFLLLASPDRLRALRPALEGRLAALGLRAKGGGVLNRCALGVPFLGFTLYPDRTRLNPPGRRRLRRGLKALERSHIAGKLSEPECQVRATSLFAHACWADNVAWRRTVCGFSRLGETLEPDQGDARRLVEQFREELPLRLPQQEESRQPEQESGLPSLSAPRHGGPVPPDDASSCARSASAHRDKTRESPPPPDIRPPGVEKAGGGASSPLPPPDA